ncbi:hypothetical protein TW95_gp0781 [Pandoravirus inopinatum]|uniref:Uncharacterized protein n=1 Tax=Pandoravirus inopinatum TaxID=1605721 RepID=A0A0B5J6U7_9VIRU|nr:hypothetical protein TW95_gp0781 [Pandoravirus inopinatum]AJF97515.1 hypothetical protein [Pandoravirus inopinatum]
MFWKGSLSSHMAKAMALLPLVPRFSLDTHKQQKRTSIFFSTHCQTNNIHRPTCPLSCRCITPVAEQAQPLFSTCPWKRKKQQPTMLSNNIAASVGLVLVGAAAATILGVAIVVIVVRDYEAFKP